MPGLSDHDLECLLADLESDRVERKQSAKHSADQIRQAICAFANDLPDHRQPGFLFVGVDDRGGPVGLLITDELLRQLADMRSDGNIVPPPVMTVQKRRLAGADLAVITVQPSNSPPVSLRGIIWVRVGPRRARASIQEEARLNEKRRHKDLPFDVRPAETATLGDLNRLRFEQEYLPSAVAPEVLAANQRTYEQRLAVTKMVQSADLATPTHLGILLLSDRVRDFLPGAYIQFLKIDGTSLADPIIDERVIDGTLGEQLHRAHDTLRSHLRTSLNLTSGPLERRVVTYPETALVQLVANAVMHRTYEHTHAPVRITWYSDRIEILSPGGPFGVVTPQNFGTPGLADYRNPNIAEALKVLGFVQRFGAGISIAKQELAKAGLPAPMFEATTDYVLAVLRR